MEKALAFIQEKHAGQTRMGGVPYYTHPVAVADILKSKGYTSAVYQLTALFHDLLEDTDATEDEIRALSAPDAEAVIHAVRLLTKSKGYDMTDYMAGIAGNVVAKMVKLADRLHNLQSALVAPVTFRARYIKETEDFYIALAKGTPFEDDIHTALTQVKNSLSA